MKNDRNQNGKTLSYSNLERRDLLAGISIETIGGRSTLVIDGSSQDDVAQVSDSNNNQVEVQLNQEVRQIDRSSFERIRFLGRSGDDTFTNNTDISSAIIGHNGNDKLVGGDGNNWIQGGDGDDVLTGGDRNDLIRGGSGNDLISGGRRHDRLFGGAGNDEIRGQQGDDFINGDSGADLITGFTGDDQLNGGFGTDRIFGGEGDDRANGGESNDTINLGAGTDIAIFDEAFARYQVGGSEGSLVVEGVNVQGTDSITAAESLRFADGVQPAIPSEPSNDANLNQAEEASLVLLNQFRSQENRSQLSSVGDLHEFARNWSLEMSRNGFRHSTEAQRSHLVTGNRSITRENIAFASDTRMSAEEAAQTFHNVWINSSVHYRNMVASGNTEVGIGLVLGSDGWYGTHVFSDG